ncbi:MAG TPA: OmpA family protein [Polyangiaceae bacterium]|nr:OmpA family protein [Polyangiaceae bacterium]
MSLTLACSAALLALGAWTGEASAQSTSTQTTQVDLPKFNPSPAGDRFFGVPSPFAAGEATFHAMALLDYAREPLVLVHDGGDDIGAIVSDQMFVHIGLNFSIINRFAISADMPFAVLSSGDAPAGGGLNFPEPSGAALGDLRLGLRVRIFGEYFDAFQLGVGGYVWVPTGGDASYVSDGSVRGQPHLLVGGRADRFIYSVSAGPTFRGTTNLGAIALGHQFDWGVGAGVLLLDERSLQLGLESSGGVDIENPDKRSTNAEILAGIKWRMAPFADFLEVGLAGGPGLTTGIGTPAGRVVFQFAYTPAMEEEKSDRDKDGIFDDVDACPDKPGVKSDDPAKNGCPPEDNDRDKDGIANDKDACPDVPGKANPDPKKNGCPDKDSDKDGILDDVDACPNEPGIPSDDPKKNGCPVHDKDGDGVADDVDACVDIPGVKTDDPKTNGCPPDTDGDGFRDDQDACPKEKGVDDPDPSKRGCPKLVRVTDKEILILEQVQFDTGKATIKPVSNPLLDSVAQVLKEHPEILKLEVQGHTDNKGSKQLNAKLSDDRAKSVRDALIKRGIDGGRLTAKGYGPDVPIADNKTEDGRQKNRRVQFIVTEKKPAEQK